MALKDIVLQGVTVSQSGIFDLKSLYKVLKHWFSENDYDFMETDFNETQKNGRKLTIIKWGTEKKLDDYIKKVIEIKLTTDTTKVEVKKGEKKQVLDQGQAKIVFTAYLLKDWEDNYEKRPIAAFFRELNDKFIDFPRIDAAKKEVMENVYSITDEFKNFFKIYG